MWKSCIKKKKVILSNLAFSEIIGSKILFSQSSSPGQCSALCSSGNADRCEPESSRAGWDESRQHRCLSRHRASPAPSSGHPAGRRGKEEAGGASAEAKGGLSSFAFNFSVLFDHLTVGVNTLVGREGERQKGQREGSHDTLPAPVTHPLELTLTGQGQCQEEREIVQADASAPASPTLPHSLAGPAPGAAPSTLPPTRDTLLKSPSPTEAVPLPPASATSHDLPSLLRRRRGRPGVLGAPPPPQAQVPLVFNLFTATGPLHAGLILLLCQHTCLILCCLSSALLIYTVSVLIIQFSTP